MGDEIKTKHPNCAGCAAGMELREVQVLGAKWEANYDKRGHLHMACTAYRYDETEKNGVLE